MNLANNCDYNLGADYKDLYGINKMLLLLNEHRDPSFLFPNLSSYNINNHLIIQFPWNDLKVEFNSTSQI